MPGARRELAEAQRAHLAAQRLLGDRQAELVPFPLCQIDEAPADHAVRRGYRTCFDLLYKRAAPLIAQDRYLAGGFSRCQPVRSLSIEADYPVPNDLQGQAGRLGRFAPAATVQDQGQRQQAPNLTGITASPGKSPQILRCVIRSNIYRSRDRKPPRVCSGESEIYLFGNPSGEPAPMGFVIRCIETIRLLTRMKQSRSLKMGGLYGYPCQG